MSSPWLTHWEMHRVGLDLGIPVAQPGAGCVRMGWLHPKGHKTGAGTCPELPLAPGKHS